MYRLVSLAVILPLALPLLLARDPDPVFGVACGAGLAGAPQEVLLHAGQHSPATIRVSIQPLRADRTSPADSSMHIEVVSGGNSGACSTSSPSPFHVYLNSADVSTVAISIRSNRPVTFRGMRGETERSSVEVNAGTADAGLTW